MIFSIKKRRPFFVDAVFLFGLALMGGEAAE
jgi:hypothetical protein